MVGEKEGKGALFDKLEEIAERAKEELLKHHPVFFLFGGEGVRYENVLPDNGHEEDGGSASEPWFSRWGNFVLFLTHPGRRFRCRAGSWSCVVEVPLALTERERFLSLATTQFVLSGELPYDLDRNLRALLGDEKFDPKMRWLELYRPDFSASLLDDTLRRR